MTIKNLSNKEFVDILLAWYAIHKRALPWRNTQDPYKIWLSEIILQQTRVLQALPYYYKLVKTFPNVKALASASEEDVLHIWQGLGYYGRARRLHICATYIAKNLKGIFPNTYRELLELPGVGPYTAAAIASIAFQESVPVLDGNVYRVLARIFGKEDDIASSSGKKSFYELAQQLMPKDLPDIYNQAIMEFGALHCKPIKARCATCPFQSFCHAYHASKQYLLPVKTRQCNLRTRYLHYLVIHRDKYVYLKKRITDDIWKGLYDFYLIEKKNKLLPFCRLGKNDLIGLIKKHKVIIKKSMYKPVHQLTHQRLYVHFFHVYANKNFIAESDCLLEKMGMKAYDDVGVLPLPVLIKRFCERELVNKS